jgi:1-phosphofructokinase
VAVFGPNPLLAITLERRGEGEEDVHLHPAGQGVWVARQAAEEGAIPILCGFVGGETGDVLDGLLARLPGEPRLVRSASATGSYVTDRRDGDRRLLAQSLSPPASRHEVDDLVSATLAAALESDALVVCNPFPPDSIELEAYEELVRDARSGGVPVLADLSSPRLDRALRGEPDVVKLNDWELAEFVRSPVPWPDGVREAAERLRAAGAGCVIVTRGGEPALALHDGGAWEVVPPHLPAGHREGCGDTMMGALAAAWARGDSWPEALVLGAAAGAANFLRHGLGTGRSDVVAGLAARIEVHELS